MLKHLRALCAAAVIVAAAIGALHTPEARAQATQLLAGKLCFQAQTGISGMLGVLGSLVGGSGGTNATYSNIALTGGSGSGGTANITVSGGAVTQVVVLNPGAQYVVGDILSASVGGVSGFSIHVLSTSINSSLAGGSVGFYIPNTLSIKQTWQDAGQSVQNTNPVTLDANGCALIYGTGTYRQILQDSLGNTVWDQLTSVPPVNPFWAGTAAGTGNAIVITDTSFAGTDGQTIQFVASAPNTGATTLNPSGFGVIPVVKDTAAGPAALTGGEIAANNVVTVTYTSATNEFHLVGSTSGSSSSTGFVSVTSYGAVGNGTTDDGAAFAAWWSACITGGSGNLCYIPPTPSGYRVARNIVWDFATIQAAGVHVFGAASQSSMMKFDSGFGLSIIDSSNVGFFYGTFDNFGVSSSVGGAAVALGQNNLADAMNGFAFRDITINNNSNSSFAIGLQINQVVDSVFSNVTVNGGCADATGSCQGFGDAIQLNAAAFNTLQVSGGHTENAVHITANGSGPAAGFNFANVFAAGDFEVVVKDILIDSNNSSGNTWQGGQFVTCFDFVGSGAASYCAGTGAPMIASTTTAAVGNVFYNPNLNPAGLDPARLGSIHIVSDRYGVVTPSLPSTTVAARNTSARKVLITFYGSGTLSQVCFGPTAGTCLSPAGTPLTVIIGPSDEIVPTYTGSIAWAWETAD